MDEQETKRIIEAALFMSSKPLSSEELAKVANIAAAGYVQQLADGLRQEYGQRGGALEIVESGGKYMMQVRAQYAQKVGVLAKEAELGRGAMRILALISKNDGIEQSKLVKMLGTTVYEYMHELVERGFVSRSKKGRTMVVRTTPKFKEYFV